MTPKYKVDGSSRPQGEDQGLKYATWRVVVAETGQLVCAFFGGASHHAAHSFCSEINNDPVWNTDEETP